MVIRIDLAESETNVYNSTGNVGLPRGRRNNKMAGQIKVSASLQEDRGKWVVRGRVCNLTTGETKQRAKSTGFPTKGNHKREAQAAMQEIIKQWELDAKAQMKDDGHMFLEYVERWLQRKEKMRIKATTLQSYRDSLRLHVAQRFADVPITEISLDDLDSFFTDFLKEHTVSSARRLNCIFSGAYQEAIRAGVVLVNLADSSHRDFPKEKKFEGSAYTGDEAAVLLDEAKKEGEPIYAAVVLATLYGLRRSEVLGLRWRDIDFNRGTLTISNTVVMSGELKIEAETTKSTHSHRVISLLPDTIPYLKSLKKAQQAAGIIHNKVCAWPDGGEVRPDFLTRKVKKVMKRAGLLPIRFHDLRHTAASLLAPMVTPQQLQHYLGHEDISTTFGTYAHYMDKERNATSATMNQIIQDAGITF